MLLNNLVLSVLCVVFLSSLLLPLASGQQGVYCWSIVSDNTQWCFSTASSMIIPVGQGNCTKGATVFQGYLANVIYNGMSEKGDSSPTTATGCCSLQGVPVLCIVSGSKVPPGKPPSVYEASLISP